uniref:Chloroplast protease n=1 Tax=Tanacetum cinerariifolium TaxID=118510 RepID=A0A6L2P0V8_TANCI|nr:chloroplast protease [Tanacetum cinerariifolium]
MVVDRGGDEVDRGEKWPAEAGGGCEWVKVGDGGEGQSKVPNFKMTPEEYKDAYKVFTERSMNEFLKVYGNVKEYYESFDSRYSNIILEQWYLVEVFICGLPWELGNNIRVYKPNSLSIAYCLALLEEISYNFTKNISMKLNESNEEEKDSDGLLVLNDDCKETESRVSRIDGDNELLVNVTVETVEESFEGQNRLIDDVRCDEAELKVSKMDDNNNSKEVEKESVESVGYKECCEENVEGLGIKTKESVDNNECLKKIVKEITRGNKIADHKIGTENVRLKSYGKSCKKDVIGKEIECLGLIAPIKLDEELNGLVELNQKNKSLEVTDNLVNEKCEKLEGG